MGGNYLTEPLEVSRAKYMDATHISVEEHKEIPNPTKPCDAEPACHFGKIYRIHQRDDGILNQVLRGMKHCPSAAPTTMVTALRASARAEHTFRLQGSK